MYNCNYRWNDLFSGWKSAHCSQHSVGQDCNRFLHSRYHSNSPPYLQGNNWHHFQHIGHHFGNVSYRLSPYHLTCSNLGKISAIGETSCTQNHLYNAQATHGRPWRGRVLGKKRRKWRSSLYRDSTEVKLEYQVSNLEIFSLTMGLHRTPESWTASPCWYLIKLYDVGWHFCHHFWGGMQLITSSK